MELMKSMPYALAAYMVFGSVLIGYFASLITRERKIEIEMEHLASIEPHSNAVEQ